MKKALYCAIVCLLNYSAFVGQCWAADESLEDQYADKNAKEKAYAAQLSTLKKEIVSVFAAECCEREGYTVQECKTLAETGHEVRGSNQLGIYLVKAVSTSRPPKEFIVKLGQDDEFRCAQQLRQALNERAELYHEVPPEELKFAWPRYIQGAHARNTGKKTQVNNVNIDEVEIVTQSQIYTLDDPVPTEVYRDRTYEEYENHEERFCLLFMDKAKGLTGNSFLEKVEDGRFPNAALPIEKIQEIYKNLAKAVNFLHKFAQTDCSKTDNFFVDPDTGVITIIDFAHVGFYNKNTRMYHHISEPVERGSDMFYWYFGPIRYRSPIELLKIFYDNLKPDLRKYIQEILGSEIKFSSYETSDSSDVEYFREEGRPSNYDSVENFYVYTGFYGDKEDFKINLESNGKNMTDEWLITGNGWKFIQDRIIPTLQEAAVKNDGETLYRIENLRRLQKDAVEKKAKNSETLKKFEVKTAANVRYLDQLFISDEEMWMIEYSSLISPEDKEKLGKIFVHYIPKPLLYIVAKSERVEKLKELGLMETIATYKMSIEELVELANTYIRYWNSCVEKRLRKGDYGDCYDYFFRIEK